MATLKGVFSVVMAIIVVAAIIGLAGLIGILGTVFGVLFFIALVTVGFYAAMTEEDQTP